MPLVIWLLLPGRSFLTNHPLATQCLLLQTPPCPSDISASVTKPFLINLRQTGYILSYLRSCNAVSTPTIMGLITDWLLERHLQVIFRCKTVRSSSVGNHAFSLRMLLFVCILILVHSTMPGWERDLVLTFIELVTLLP